MLTTHPLMTIVVVAIWEKWYIALVIISYFSNVFSIQNNIAANNSDINNSNSTNNNNNNNYGNNNNENNHNISDIMFINSNRYKIIDNMLQHIVLNNKENRYNNSFSHVMPFIDNQVASQLTNIKYHVLTSRDNNNNNNNNKNNSNSNNNKILKNDFRPSPLINFTTDDTILTHHNIIYNHNHYNKNTNNNNKINNNNNNRDNFNNINDKANVNKSNNIEKKGFIFPSNKYNNNNNNDKHDENNVRLEEPRFKIPFIYNKYNRNNNGNNEHEQSPYQQEYLVQSTLIVGQKGQIQQHDQQKQQQYVDYNRPYTLRSNQFENVLYGKSNDFKVNAPKYGKLYNYNDNNGKNNYINNGNDNNEKENDFTKSNHTNTISYKFRLPHQQQQQFLHTTNPLRAKEYRPNLVTSASTAIHPTLSTSLITTFPNYLNMKYNNNNNKNNIINNNNSDENQHNYLLYEEKSPSIAATSNNHYKQEQHQQQQRRKYMHSPPHEYNLKAFGLKMPFALTPTTLPTTTNDVLSNLRPSYLNYHNYQNFNESQQMGLNYQIKSQQQQQIQQQLERHYHRHHPYQIGPSNLNFSTQLAQYAPQITKLLMGETSPLKPYKTFLGAFFNLNSQTDHIRLTNSTKPTSMPLNNRLIKALENIARNDELQCVPKVLCRMIAVRTERGQLPNFLTSPTTTGFLTAFPISSPALIYGRAVLLGVTGGEMSCQQLYSKCPKNDNEIIHYLNNYRGGFFKFFNEPQTNVNTYNQQNDCYYQQQHHPQQQEQQQFNSGNNGNVQHENGATNTSNTWLNILATLTDTQTPTSTSTLTPTQTQTHATYFDIINRIGNMFLQLLSR